MTNLPDMNNPDALRDHARAERVRKRDLFTVGDEVLIGPDMARIEVVTPYGPALTVKVRFTTGDRKGQLHGTMIQDLGEVDAITKLGSIFTKMLEDQEADADADKADAKVEAAEEAGEEVGPQMSNPALTADKPKRAPKGEVISCDCPCHRNEPFVHDLPCCTAVYANGRNIPLGVALIEFRIKMGRLTRKGVEGLGTDRPEDTYCPVCDLRGHAESSPACELFGEYGQR